MTSSDWRHERVKGLAEAFARPRTVKEWEEMIHDGMRYGVRQIDLLDELEQLLNIEDTKGERPASDAG